MADSPSHRKGRIGLALSGGTLKATAHVGVLSALQDLGIAPDCIAGTSAGSFIAALYAHGYTPDVLRQLIRRFPGPSLFDYGFPLISSLGTYASYAMPTINPLAKWSRIRIPSGLLRGDRLYRYFAKWFKGKSPQLPYYVIATDLVTGNPVSFTNEEAAWKQGYGIPVEDVAKCIRGSCSLPGIFTPTRIGQKLLVDGAFRHYVPADVLRQAGCTKILAVNLYSLQQDWKPRTLMHVLARSYEILLKESVDDDLHAPDTVVIEPDVSHLHWLSFQDMESGVDIGRNAVLSKQLEIEEMFRENEHGIRVRFLRSKEITR